MLLTRRATGEKIGRVTVSGGVAQCCVPESAQTLVARADSALYDAKRNGRNRIASAAA
jgi:diguanylate cyclase